MTVDRKTVPLSRALGNGTVGHETETATANTSTSLKSLARRVLSRSDTAAFPVAALVSASTPAAAWDRSSDNARAADRSTFHQQRSINFEERAAIIEFDGAAPRSWAEGFARLDLSHPIPGFTGADWRQLIDDGGRFLDRWASEAGSLGWTAEDVFGLNPAAPATRYDGMGLVALIRGGEVVDVKSDRATIRMNSGSCLTYYLRSPRPGAVALWELL